MKTFVLKEIHLSKKDFRIEWFSGTGAGGQHRNKHQNCCRIIHIDTGLRAQGTNHRERTTNQKNAFTRLAGLIVAHYADETLGRRSGAEVIRNYHGVRNEVLDKASRLKMSYKDVVVNGNIGPMIDARRQAVCGEIK